MYVFIFGGCIRSPIAFFPLIHAYLSKPRFSSIFRLLRKKCITQKIEENPDKDFLVVTTAESFQGKWCDKNRTKMEKTCQAY